MFITEIAHLSHEYTVAGWTSSAINFICIIAGVALAYWLFTLSRNDKRRPTISKLAVIFACLAVLTGGLSPIFDQRINPSLSEARSAKTDLSIERVANQQEYHPTSARGRYLSCHHYHKIPKVKFYYYL